jgi:Peptidase family M23
MKEQNKPGVATGVFTSPVKNGGVSSGYGWRNHPLKGGKVFHHGLDIAAPDGVAQFAPDGGIVRYAGSAGTAGNTVVIDHGNGVVSRLFHMGTVIVPEGTKVSKGQVIGTVGNTGASKGPHVHWEVLQGTTQGFGGEIKNNSINPKPFLTNGDYSKYTNQKSKESRYSSSNDKSSANDSMITMNSKDVASNTISQDSIKLFASLNNTDDNQATLMGLNKKLYSLAEEASEGNNKKLVEHLQQWGENGITAYAENHPSVKDLPESAKAQEVAKAFAVEQISLG